MNRWVKERIMKSKNRNLINRLLTVIILVLFTTGAAMIVIPRYNNWREQQVRDELLAQIDNGTPETIWVDPEPLMADHEVYDIYIPAEDAADGYEIAESVRADRLRARQDALGNPDDGQDGLVAVNAYGRLTISSIGVDLPLIDNLNHINLRYGAVHYEETVQPGEVGYSAIFGHRRWQGGNDLLRLDELMPDDTFTVQVGQTVYHYVVERNIVVRPSEIFDYIFEPTDQAKVIIVTCDPVPAWTHRMLVIARQTGTTEL